MEHTRFRLLLSSLVALVALQMQAEAQQLPRLVVCITIDQLRSDYLAELSPLMSDVGLKHIVSKGKVCDQVAFPLSQPSVASTTASIFTGTYPRQHGIEAVESYVRSSGHYQNLFVDNNYIGSYTRDNFSPKNLLIHTIGDRLKEASGGSALVYSIAPTAEGAITSAGLMADGAYWLDERICSWASSSYYPQMLPSIDQYNRSQQGPNKRLTSGISWKPLRSYKRPDISYADWNRSFHRKFSLKEAKAFRESGLVNEEVTTLALRLIEAAGYAQRKSPGLLAVSYTAKPQGNGELEPEDVDTYLRLDAEIGRLLKTIDREIGLKNCLVTLSGTGYTSYPSISTDAKGQRLKRSLNIGRITALTNMYLTALYGSGEWIQDNRNGRLYLNPRIVESRKLDLGVVQRQIATFLSAAEGIDYAIAGLDIGSASSLEGQSLARSIHPRYLADVYWSVLPSWQIEDLKDNPLLQTRCVGMPSLFVMLGDPALIEQAKYNVRDVRDIVRVICNILRIRPPTY